MCDRVGGHSQVLGLQRQWSAGPLQLQQSVLPNGCDGVRYSEKLTGTQNSTFQIHASTIPSHKHDAGFFLYILPAAPDTEARFYSSILPSHPSDIIQFSGTFILIN